jgi:hypothetical protein
MLWSGSRKELSVQTRLHIHRSQSQYKLYLLLTSRSINESLAAMRTALPVACTQSFDSITLTSTKHRLSAMGLVGGAAAQDPCGNGHMHDS